MKIIGEMILTDYFRLSTGHVALVGYIKPEIDIILKCKAYLYAGNVKLRSIDIIGEDKFTGVNESIRKGRRAVRTSEDIYNDLKLIENKEIKLIFYANENEEMSR